MGTRRVRVCLAGATALALVTLGGCGSAADVVAGGRPSTESSRNEGKQTEPTTSGPTSGPTKPSPTKQPTTAPPSPRHGQLPKVVGTVRVFQTPSRNIGCRITSGGARCDIRQHVYREPTRPPGCRGDYGQSLKVSGGDVGAFVCVTDSVFAPGARVLKYGTSTVVGDFGCTSRITGIRCLSLLSRHGFRLSQSSPSVF